MELGLHGKVALVTGGSDGLGRATATTLAREGVRVAIVARGVERLAAAAQGIRESIAGAEVVTISADVASADSAETILERTVDAFGGLDILVNNAGTAAGRPFDQIDDGDWVADLELKLLGAARLVRLAVPHLRARGGGRIVNILAGAAKAPGAQSAPSSVSRAAGMAMTKVLSKELAADQILVNAILIGLVKSGQWERRAGDADLEALYERMAEGIPVKRVAEASELADLVAFLVSDRAAYITGCAINFDGGALPVV
jgi:NAD(P)-dependent dehydrogenase (short-subunit alcohol dehydrogenase family)